jgi:hypothetical protein
VKYTRIYSGDDGQSHFEDVEFDLEDRGPVGAISALWKGPGAMFREVGGDYNYDYHNAPRRQFVVNLTGSVDIEVGDGTVRRMEPGSILLAEDLTGQGHISRGVNDEPRTCIFIPLAD